MGGRHYNLRTGETPDLLARLAESIAAVRCGRGEHRTETDEVTGDEVCRYCKTVVES